MPSPHFRAQTILFWLCLSSMTACSPASAPRILKQPESVTARVGEPVNLSVAAQGDGPSMYAWYSEREQVPGAIKPVLQFDHVTEEDTGLYWVTISNRWGRVGSDGVLLRV